MLEYLFTKSGHVNLTKNLITLHESHDFSKRGVTEIDSFLKIEEDIMRSVGGQRFMMRILVIEMSDAVVEESLLILK